MKSTQFCHDLGKCNQKKLERRSQYFHIFGKKVILRSRDNFYNEEYLAIQEILEDWEDLNDLRQAKQDEENLPILSLEEIKKELGDRTIFSD
ncbi:hypothetical protein [Spirulina sp. 06S082]|uniref:hypothetical protein n=1 Tax=Spirulina sp. 06S082 TaxID=3110248 RepID=UPI002B20FF2A|nr:hypothetical protein [Spirulina sp. 06S082]MEA5472301.1 hypothetical protein [Spirulina sp. 06S082]